MAIAANNIALDPFSIFPLKTAQEPSWLFPDCLCGWDKNRGHMYHQPKNVLLRASLKLKNCIKFECPPNMGLGTLFNPFLGVGDPDSTPTPPTQRRETPVPRSKVRSTRRVRTGICDCRVKPSLVRNTRGPRGSMLSLKKYTYICRVNCKYDTVKLYTVISLACTIEIYI